MLLLCCGNWGLLTQTVSILFILALNNMFNLVPWISCCLGFFKYLEMSLLVSREFRSYNLPIRSPNSKLWLLTMWMCVVFQLYMVFQGSWWLGPQTTINKWLNECFYVRMLSLLKKTKNNTTNKRIHGVFGLAHYLMF